MKFDVATLVLLASTAHVSAFAPLQAAAESRVRLSATVEESTTTSGKLIPPLMPSEIVNEDGRVSALYDGNVQKTYG